MTNRSDTIMSTLSAIMRGERPVPSESAQRAAFHGMTLELMVSENGTYRASVDGRTLVAKKAEGTQVARIKAP